MKASNPEKRKFEGRSAARHRLQDVDSPSGERDRGLGAPLALTSFSIAEVFGARRTAQGGGGGLVEDSLESLVAVPHPAMVVHSLAGVESGVGSEPVRSKEVEKQ